MTSDQDGERRRAGSWASGVKERLVPGSRTLLRELFDFSSRPLPVLSRVQNRVLRQLPLIVSVVFALYVAVPGADALSDRLPLPWLVAVVIAVAQAAAVPLGLVRPVAAWWLSLAAMVPFPVLVVATQALPGRDSPWPWTEPGFLAHLVVTLLVAWRVHTPLFVTQWVVSILAGGVLGLMLPPSEAGHGLVSFGILSAFGLALQAALRGRREARRQLRRQERLTEIERFRRTVLEERARIARELHDVVAHHMSVVAVQAEAAPYLVPDPPQPLDESFRSIRRNALAALSELRHILGMMRSDEPSADGRYVPQPTLANIEELVGNVRAAGLRVETEISGTPRALPNRVELSAFRILQEALSNVLRHAPGAEVRVELSYGGSALTLRVINSPAAAAVPRQGGKGHGLLGMRERAAMLGGTLHVGPMDDGWFEVRALLPAGEGEDS
ncbi:sensor histidine kinase [Streptomyces sp. NPDC093097]|uniref:sensor histidine kinase n=1 Tax=Streptomyces sp. NPDC093097 TaxID=3366027 RepID=UPI0037F2625D